MSLSQVVHSQSNNWWRKAFVAPSEQSKQRLIWTERELQTSLDQCNAMQCKSSLKVTRKSFQGGDLIFTGAGEIAFDAYKEWFVSWGPAGKIKVCMISPKNSYHPMGRYLGLCSPYMKNDKTKFWQLLSSTYFSSSGEDSATEHRVHERLHSPGRHGDDGRQPTMDSARCINSCLFNLLNRTPTHPASAYPASNAMNQICLNT